jgi:hypothetical protein
VIDFGDEPSNLKLDPLRFDDIELQDGSKSTESAASLPSSQEQQPKPPGEAPRVSPQNHEWISGPRLVFMMTGVTLVAFLMLLDTSIIATVNIMRQRIMVLSVLTILAGYA